MARELAAEASGEWHQADPFQGCRNCNPGSQKLRSRAPNCLVLLRFQGGTGFAWLGVVTVRRIAAQSIMGVIGHPFVPYILVLLGLLRKL